MKLATLIAAPALLVMPAMAQPAYTLDRDRLTVTGAEIAVVEGPGIVLETGFALIDLGTPPAGLNGVAAPDAQGRVVWTLAPGEYRLWAVEPATGVRPVSEWTITVAAPDRAQRIIDAVRRVLVARDAIAAAQAGLDAALAESAAARVGLAGLSPTIPEIVTAAQAGPVPAPVTGPQ